MGMFSWHTNDTGEPIWNEMSEVGTKTVYMIDDKGNKWKEDSYQGYGVFGGKDYYELLAEMNGLGSDREKGIKLWCGKKPFIAPQLVENPKHKWENVKPKDHSGQGFIPDDYDKD